MPHIYYSFKTSSCLYKSRMRAQIISINRDFWKTNGLVIKQDMKPYMTPLLQKSIQVQVSRLVNRICLLIIWYDWVGAYFVFSRIIMRLKALVNNVQCARKYCRWTSGFISSFKIMFFSCLNVRVRERERERGRNGVKEQRTERVRFIQTEHS